MPTLPSIVPVLLVLLVAFLFYGLIPGLGAFAVRGQWRRFRTGLVASSLNPLVRYSDLRGPDRFLGQYRFFGQLEAMQGDTRVWITNGSFSVEADLAGIPVYLLPSRTVPPAEDPGGETNGAGIDERLLATLPEEEPRSVRWQGIYSLPAGTRVYIGGPLELEGGRALFRSRPREPLVVVIYEGEENTILQRAIWGGRQRNEYWNRYTLASLITGSFCLFLIAFLLLRFPLLRLTALAALTLCSAPLALLLPPGVVLYTLYVRSWKQARLLRARRDLLVLPLRYFRGRSDPPGQGLLTALLPSGETYAMLRERPGDGETGGGSTRFGVLGQEGGRVQLAAPADPMAETVVIPGDPVRLSLECSRRARRLEWLAALLAAGGLAANLLLVLIVLSYLIR